MVAVTEQLLSESTSATCALWKAKIKIKPHFSSNIVWYYKKQRRSIYSDVLSWDSIDEKRQALVHHNNPKTK